MPLGIAQKLHPPLTTKKKPSSLLWLPKINCTRTTVHDRFSCSSPREMSRRASCPRPCPPRRHWREPSRRPSGLSNKEDPSRSLSPFLRQQDCGDLQKKKLDGACSKALPPPPLLRIFTCASASRRRHLLRKKEEEGEGKPLDQIKEKLFF